KPLLDGATYAVVFGLLMNAANGVDAFIPALIIGVCMFQYTARCLNQGAMALVSNRGLIRGFQFPRAALPAAVVTREVIHSVPVVVTMLFLIIVTSPGPSIGPTWLLGPAVFILQTALNFGLSLV